MSNMVQTRRNAGGGNRLVGFVALDPVAVGHDLAAITSKDWSGAYGDYAVGTWQSCMLWNRSGRASDALSQEYAGAALPTELGRRTGHLSDLVRATFDVTRIKSVRLFRAANFGCIRPHRDYMEFKRGFARYHVVLKTHDQAFNSEDGVVFQLKDGEVWFLDGRRVHSGGVTSKDERIHLVVDLDPEITDEQAIAADVRARAADHTPTLRARQPLDRKTERALRALWPLLSEFTLQEFCDLYAKIHVVRDVHAGQMYAWLDRMAQQTKDAALITKVQRLQKVFVGG